MNVIIEVRTIEGELVDRQETHNDVVRGAWNMFACAFASSTYSFRVNKMKCGSGTTPVTEADTALANPWTMGYITAGTQTKSSPELISEFSIPANTYVGNTLTEVGIYYDQFSGTVPITVPALYARCLLQSPIVIQADQIVSIRHTKGFE